MPGRWRRFSVGLFVMEDSETFSLPLFCFFVSFCQIRVEQQVAREKAERGRLFASAKCGTAEADAAICAGILGITGPVAGATAAAAAVGNGTVTAAAAKTAGAAAQAELGAAAKPAPAAAPAAAAAATAATAASESAKSLRVQPAASPPALSSPRRDSCEVTMAELRRAEDALTEANALMITQMQVFRATKRECVGVTGAAKAVAAAAAAGAGAGGNASEAHLEKEVIEAVRCVEGLIRVLDHFCAGSLRRLKPCMLAACSGVSRALESVPPVAGVLLALLLN